MICPNCHSDNCSIVSETNSTGKDFSAGKGCCGAILLGPIGILCGACGKGKTIQTSHYWVCNSCGTKFNGSFSDQEVNSLDTTVVQETKQSSSVTIIAAVLIGTVIIAALLALIIPAIIPQKQELYTGGGSSTVENNSMNKSEAEEVSDSDFSLECSLFDVPLLFSNYDIREIGTYEDKLGNEYPDTLYYPYGYGGQNDIYVLSKDFSTFSGTIFVPSDRGSHDASSTGLRVIMYGDEKRIYTSPQMQAISFPVDFSIDVRGIDQLKIIYQGGADTWPRSIGLTDLKLTKSTNPKDKEYESDIPMRLLDLPELENNFIDYNDRVLSDKFGNVYEDCTIYLFGAKDSRASYALQGKYSHLTGTIFVPEERGYESSCWDEAYYVKIYGDDELLYTSPQMRYDVSPADFDIDVSGVQLLTITYYGGASTWFREIGLADLFVYE